MCIRSLIRRHHPDTRSSVSVTVPRPCDQTVALLKDRLRIEGLRVISEVDLSATAGPTRVLLEVFLETTDDALDPITSLCRRVPCQVLVSDQGPSTRLMASRHETPHGPGGADGRHVEVGADLRGRVIAALATTVTGWSWPPESG